MHVDCTIICTHRPLSPPNASYVLAIGSQVNRYLVDREGGDARITLRKNLPQPPRGFTGMQAHGLKSLAGVQTIPC